MLLIKHTNMTRKQDIELLETLNNYYKIAHETIFRSIKTCIGKWKSKR